MLSGMKDDFDKAGADKRRKKEEARAEKAAAKAAAAAARTKKAANRYYVSGLNALMRAVESGNISTIQKLIHDGAELDAKSRDPSPLSEAAPYERESTALHIAALRGEAKIVDLLLYAGADPNVRNRAGQTAVDSVLLREIYWQKKLTRRENGWLPLPGAKQAAREVKNCEKMIRLMMQHGGGAAFYETPEKYSHPAAGKRDSGPKLP